MNLLVKSSRGGKNGKLNEMIEVSVLWSTPPSVGEATHIISVKKSKMKK